MKKINNRHKNENGSAFELLLVVVIFGLISLVGFYSYSLTIEQNETSQKTVEVSSDFYPSETK